MERTKYIVEEWRLKILLRSNFIMLGLMEGEMLSEETKTKAEAYVNKAFDSKDIDSLVEEKLDTFKKRKYFIL